MLRLKAIRAIWKKYKAQIMAGDGFKSSANRDPDIN
jgi:hypothetical protein